MSNGLNKEQLTTAVQEFVLAAGADLCGFAELAPLQGFLQTHYGDRWNGYRSAVSLSVNMPREVVYPLLEGPTHEYLRYYDSLNALIDQICFRTANFLDAKGYRAYPIPASQMQGGTKCESIFSHRLAAHQAGLGWVGKSCSLIRPDRGPLHRLGTIVTDAEFCWGEPMENRCGSCHACMDACPAKALKGVTLEDAEEREARFEAFLCQEYLHKVRVNFGKEICGMCLAACPHGRRK